MGTPFTWGKRPTKTEGATRINPHQALERHWNRSWISCKGGQILNQDVCFPLFLQSCFTSSRTWRTSSAFIVSMQFVLVVAQGGENTERNCPKRPIFVWSAQGPTRTCPNRGDVEEPPNKQAKERGQDKSSLSFGIVSEPLRVSLFYFYFFHFFVLMSRLLEVRVCIW